MLKSERRLSAGAKAGSDRSEFNNLCFSYGVSVSKIKSPQDKKTLSLRRDRRNVYGENHAGSLKGIRRGKQRSHMGERRAVNQILGHLRESAAEDEATEADVLAKTSIAKSKHKAFKKFPDSPLGVVIKEKLANRTQQEIASPTYPFRYYISFDAKGVFDTLYNSTFHKQPLLFAFRSVTGNLRWGRQEKKTEIRLNRKREDAVRLREAILRDAPLLKGFFAEEPKWREKALLWCERVLLTGSDPNKPLTKSPSQ